MSVPRFSQALREQPWLVIDGSMASALEHYGCDVDHPLWTALSLRNAPARIEQVHYDYFAAGANVAITASYQASLPGFIAQGMSADEAYDLIAQSVTLAQQARQRYEQNYPQTKGTHWIAGSIGPYGAYLADGSEYRGDYEMDVQQLERFHRPRIAALLAAGADVFAIETQPSLAEVLVILELIDREFTDAEVWVSFSCRDATHIAEGTPLQYCAKRIAAYSQVVALGVNCTAPPFITPLLKQLRAVTDKPLVAYPNSGEHYDALTKQWQTGDAATSCWHAVPEWLAAGAKLIGGCCRTQAADIRGLATLKSQSVIDPD